MGYSADALEMFHTEFLDLITETLPQCKSSPTLLHSTLTEEGGVCEYCTWYMRPLCSLVLKSDPKYASFLDDEYADVADFCKREVEPMGRECDQLQVIGEGREGKGISSHR